MANGGAAGGARWLLAPVIALALGVGGASAADLEAAWDAQLRGRLEQAQMLLETDVPATPAHRLALAGVALELGDLDRARAALEPLAADAGHPDYPCAALLLGRLHLAAGRDEAARNAFSASLERSADGPYAPAAYLALIRLDLSARAFDEAGERLHRLTDLGPSPELDIAVGLLNPNGSAGTVRPFPSPLGLFAAARLSGGVELPPLASPGPPRGSDADSGRPSGPGLQPITRAESLQTPAALLPAISAEAPREESDAAQASTRKGLVSVAVPADRGSPRFTLRLGSFRDLINAQHMLKALQDAKFPVRIRPGGALHQVLVGVVATRQAAELVLKRLQEIGYDGDIIPYSADAGR